MSSVNKVLFFLLAINALFIVMFFINTDSDNSPATNTSAFTKSSITKHGADSDDSDDDVKSSSKKPSHKKDSKKKSTKKLTNKEKAKKAEKELKEVQKELKTIKKTLEESNTRAEDLNKRSSNVGQVLRWSNPFFLLGAYPRIGNEYFNSYPDGRPYYEKTMYGIINDNDYCELVDLYNLAHPENMFKSMNFFTDYSRTGLTRAQVVRKIGVDTMRMVSRYMKKKEFNKPQFHLTPTITNFFTKRVDVHIYHTIGKHFNCATQMYNHIPGHGVLKRKDLIVDSVDTYAARFEDGREHCFNKKKFFPYSYRLYIEDECKDFFNHINSKKYIKSLEEEPIQFVIKLGYGAHRAQGVFIFNANETEIWREFYQNGEKCGAENKSIVAQTYITNPLLLDKNNKFDFRVYMLVASTNPLIVYYHDGFLRVSLEVYEKFSNNKNVHLTNTHLSKDTFAKVEAENATKAQELRDYQMWTFERLGDYLYESNKVDDPDWVNNTLRPKFYEAFIHTVRMTGHAFWNQSNVYELYGLDFMLDDELNLWFIECNSSPQLIGTNDHKTKFLVQMLEDLFEIQYGLYRSRMQRILSVLKRMSKESAETGAVDYAIWRDEYAKAAVNRFEPEYEPSKDNSFKLIMDMSLEGPNAFFGHLSKTCSA